nr:MAG TPA: hypothetical protein [Caudoviricetes sp.]
MYVGDSSNSPVEQMSVKKYSQTSNPNLLDNTNFFNPINQRNQTSYSNTDAAPKYSIDRWQVLGGTFDVQTRTYTSNSTLGIYGNQFRQYIPLENVSIGDTITVSSVINDTRHVFTTTIPQYGDTVADAPFLLETTWGGFKMITREAEHAALLTMVVNVSQSITVDWIKMEFGNFATPYVPKEYGAELAECLRYFQRVYADWRIYPTLKDMPYRFSQSTLQVMRIKPTISAHGTPYTFGCTINALDAQPMAFTVETKITERGQNAAAASMLGHFDLSADI